MFLEKVVGDKTQHDLIRRGLNYLNDSLLFAALLEVAAKGQDQQQEGDLIQLNALRNAERDGYVKALADIQNFFTKFVDIQDKLPRPSYGAWDELLNNGSITREEYDRREFAKPAS